MRKAKILKKAADFRVREGLGAVLLAEVHLIRTTIGQILGEGTQEKDEQGKSDESTQPPPDMTSASTHPPPTTTTQAPILTSTTTTPLPIPPSICVTTSTTLPPVTTTLTPTIEKVIIHNIELDSDQEEEQPVVQLVQNKAKKKEKKSSRFEKQAPGDPMDIDKQDLLGKLLVGK